jgi:hypothetical protein
VRGLPAGVTPEDVFAHPRHLAAQELLPQLIGELRNCVSVQDGYDFQQALLGRVLSVESERNAFSQAVKRIRAGRGPQPGAPDPVSGLDPSRPATWQLELEVCRRVGRQLRCVGDALAWRVFGFQRQHIIALSQNQPSGVMAGKKGLQAETAAVDKALADGHFAILHDLTNCLRVGDITVFGDDGMATIIEVKSDPGRSKTVQQRRITAAVDAVRRGGPLPGHDRKRVLYDLDLPFRTHLNVLADGSARAAQDGLFAARVPGDRALLVADMQGCGKQGWTLEEFGRRLDSKYNSATRRAGLGSDKQWHVTATSADSVSIDPLRAPFAAYPLDPVTCARIIGDYVTFSVVTSGPALEETLRRGGLQARWIRPPAAGDLSPSEVVMEITAEVSGPAPPGITAAMHRGALRVVFSQTLQMCRAELDMYLIQLLDQGTWIEGIRHMVSHDQHRGHPWPHYRGEDQVWA